VVVIGEGEHEATSKSRAMACCRLSTWRASMPSLPGSVKRYPAARCGCRKAVEPRFAETLSAAFEFLLALRTRHQKER
jgi:hypothetical protein